MKKVLILLLASTWSLSIFAQQSPKITFGPTPADMQEMRFTLDQRDTVEMEYFVRGSWVRVGYVVKITNDCIYDSSNAGHQGETWNKGNEFYTMDWIRIREEDILIWRQRPSMRFILFKD